MSNACRVRLMLYSVFFVAAALLVFPGEGEGPTAAPMMASLTLDSVSRRNVLDLFERLPFPLTDVLPASVLGGIPQNLSSMKKYFVFDLPETDLPHLSTPARAMETVDAFLGYGLARHRASLLRQRSPLTDETLGKVRQVRDAYVRYYEKVTSLLRENGTEYTLRMQGLPHKEGEDIFWGTLAPTLVCPSLKRIGPLADDTRFLCGVHALKKKSQKKPSSSPLQIVGFGSANKWEWEKGLQQEFGPDNVIFKINDCTVGRFHPPTVGTIHTYHNCLGGPRLGSGPQYMRMLHIPQRLFGGRFGVHLDILKIDVEGWEFYALPDWLHDVSQRSLHEDLPFYVDQFQLEFHRLGHKTLKARSFRGLLYAHYLFLHFYALGFVPYVHEPNYFNKCCFEFALANATWFILHDVT